MLNAPKKTRIATLFAVESSGRTDFCQLETALTVALMPKLGIASRQSNDWALPTYLLADNRIANSTTCLELGALP